MFSVTHLIQSGGLLLLGLFLFAEVGLFIGFFLPGDTLLITAAIYAKQGKLNIAAVILVAAVAAVAGDSLAYYFGRKLGPSVFRKEDSVLFDKKHVAAAEKFYDRYGAKILLVSHFLPVVRTFTPLLAGVGSMPYKRFLKFDATGDTAWAIIIALLGYYIGSRIPNIDHYIVLIVILAVVLSSGPTLIQFIRLQLRRRKRRS
jgi:membrane-associated protein